jgi:thioester reductase-like protein
MDSLISYLNHWASVQPEQRYATFLDLHGNETESYTYRAFSERTAYVAEYLSQQVGLKRGERALLVYPPGLEIIVVFFACARIGVIPVPVYPPAQITHERRSAKLAFIIHDCQPAIALTTSHNLQYSDPFGLRCIATDHVDGQSGETLNHDAGSILFLQYTSGSTSEPKGVIVSHENVIHNCFVIADHKPISVSWLPQYHDMGLIGYYLFTCISGGTTYGFSPVDFLRRPLLWLQTLSHVRATCTSAPNFGFEYCLREDKVPSAQLAGLDLSSLRVVMNASEPARPETHRRFLERFAPYGLRSEAHVVAYGLAENTLAVSHRGRRSARFDGRELMSSGEPLEGIRVRIVDPKSGEALRDREIGEVWVAGTSTCRGYWNRPELTEQTFRNAITNDAADSKRYLRTGDLGLFDGAELFICGRIKDLIIVRGVNYYPQDIESAVESASPKIRTGGVAAFQADEEGRGLVVIAELKQAKDLPEPAEIVQAIYARCELRPDTIVFVPARSIAKTTSGKIARHATRQQWLAGKLRVIATHNCLADELRLRNFLERYHLKGDEGYTLGELGIDSLGMVSLLDNIEAVLMDHGLTDLLSEIDVGLLQRLKVKELLSLLDSIEKKSAEQIAAVRLMLDELQQGHDEKLRQRMRLDAQLDIARVDPSARESIRNVLLTGPTWFFGPFLLHSLLTQTPYRYHVLTRAVDAEHGMDRIHESLRRAQLLTPELEDSLRTRVQAVCGDIARPNLGLNLDQWQSLSRNVQAVIHNAALVNYVLNYDALRPANVEGTRELLRFSATATPKEFHFISSTVMFGWNVKAELFETDNNDEMLNLDFGYAQTKWVAEQLVFAAEKQGLEVRVYRPSFITASTHSVASSDDIVIRLLAFMINEGIAVNAKNQISFLPAEVVANHIAAIFKQRATPARTFHVTADDYYNLADITRLISHEYGYRFVYYDIPDFVRELKRRCTPDNLLYPLLDFFNRSQRKIAAMQRKRYNNDHYRAARKASGNGDSDPPLKDIVAYVMSYMLREGLIRGSRGNAPSDIEGQIEAGIDQHEESHVQERPAPRVSRLDASLRPIRS